MSLIRLFCLLLTIKVQKPQRAVAKVFFIGVWLFGFLGCTGKSTVSVGKPEPFAITAANPTAPLQAEISWQSAKNASTYKVEYGTTSGNYTNVISENASSPLVVTGLQDGVTYYFKVSASNLAGMQTASNEISITVYANLSFASVSPAEGFFAGDQTITLTGTGFKPGSTVQIAGSSCTSVNVISSSTITCKTPTRLTPGATSISVVDPSGNTVTLMNGYSYKSDAFQRLEFFAGTQAKTGHKNAVGTAAKFFRPSKPLVYNGYVYISDTNNHMIRRMNLSTLLVEDVAGSAFMPGTTDGVGSAARFYYPMGMALVGTDIYIADSANCLIRKLNTLNNAVTTIAGQGSSCTAAENANGALAGFGNIHALTTDGTYLYIADDSAQIARVSLSPPHATNWITATTMSVTDIVYLNGDLYYTEFALDYSLTKFNLTTMTGASAISNTVSVLGGVETDGTDIFLTYSDSNLIKRLSSATSTLTTIVGDGSPGGEADGLGVIAKVDRPAGMFYSAGELYFTSYGSSTIRKFNVSTTAVTTLTGGGL